MGKIIFRRWGKKERFPLLGLRMLRREMGSKRGSLPPKEGDLTCMHLVWWPSLMSCSGGVCTMGLQTLVFVTVLALKVGNLWQLKSLTNLGASPDSSVVSVHAVSEKPQVRFQGLPTYLSSALYRPLCGVIAYHLQHEYSYVCYVSSSEQSDL